MRRLTYENLAEISKQINASARTGNTPARRATSAEARAGRAEPERGERKRSAMMILHEDVGAMCSRSRDQTSLTFSIPNPA